MCTVKCRKSPQGSTGWLSCGDAGGTSCLSNLHSKPLREQAAGRAATPGRRCRTHSPCQGPARSAADRCNLHGACMRSRPHAEVQCAEHATGAVPHIHCKAVGTALLDTLHACWCLPGLMLQAAPCHPRRRRAPPGGQRWSPAAQRASRAASPATRSCTPPGRRSAPPSPPRAPGPRHPRPRHSTYVP